MQLTVSEANLIADICNPGFGPELYPDPAMAPQSLMASVADTFQDLYPGQFGEKWAVDEKALWAKLMGADKVELGILCVAITQFWDHCDEPREMGAYLPAEMLDAARKDEQ